MDIRLQHKRGKTWTRRQQGKIQVWVKGFAFFDDVFYQGPGFAALIGRILAERDWRQPAESFAETAKKLNGQFACVAFGERKVLAAVDRLRSIPLFYGLRDDGLVLGDAADWVRNRTGRGSFSSEARQEFLLAGYVTGSETLCPSVRQLQAGELLSWGETAGRRAEDPKVVRYYEFLRRTREPDDFSFKEREFDALSGKVFERLIRSLDGRTLVVPLSGGYDSRYIATMLKRLDYGDVICFSYGARGNGESAVSAGVARRLGYPWHFIPYTRRLWRDYYRDGQKESFFSYAADLTSLPCVQDWPAVGELKRRELVPDNAVFAPGNKGFIYSNPMREVIESRPVIDREFLTGLILDNYYNLWDWSGAEETLGPIFTRRIQEHLTDGLALETTADLIAASELWEFQERQAKFIVNSMRCYEYWGYDWRLPICDSEMMDFWLDIDNKSWYLSFLRRWRHFGLSHSSPTNPTARFVKSRLKRLLLAWKPLYSGKMKLDRWRNRYFDYVWHPYRWYGIHGPREHIAATSPSAPFRWAKTSNINSVLARDYLNKPPADGSNPAAGEGD